MSLTRQIIVEQREKSKYQNQSGISQEQLKKKQEQLEKELKKQMEILEKIQNSNIDESGIRLEERQNISIIRKRQIEKHRNKYVKEAIQYKSQAQVSIEQQLARQKKDMIQANIKNFDSSNKQQFLKQSLSQPKDFQHHTNKQNINQNDEASRKSLESLKNYNNQAPQIFQINVSTINNKNEKGNIPIGLMRTERVSETYMSQEKSASKQQNKFLSNNIDLLNTHQVATSTKQVIGVTQSVNQESFGFSGTTTSFKMEMSDVHTLARAGNIYKDNDAKQNAAHLDYMKLIKQGNSRKTIQGESSVYNQKNKNADLTEFNNNWHKSQSKFQVSNQISKQFATNSPSNNNIKQKQQTQFQQQIINVIDQKLNYDPQFKQYQNKDIYRGNIGYIYTNEQNTQNSYQNQSNFIDNQQSQSNIPYNVNDIITSLNIPILNNEPPIENIPHQDFSKINQTLEAKKNFSEFKKFVSSSPQISYQKSLKKQKNIISVNQKQNIDINYQNSILQIGNQQYSNSSSQEFITDQNNNDNQGLQPISQEKENFLKSMFDQQNSRNLNEQIQQIAYSFQNVQQSQMQHQKSSKSLKYKDEYVQSNEYSNEINGIGHDLLKNQIQSNRESKEQLVIAVMDSLSRNDSLSKENSLSQVQKTNIQNIETNKIHSFKQDLQKLNVVGTGKISPTKQILNQDLEIALASPITSPTSVNNYNKKLQLMKQNIENKNIKLIDQVVGKNYQYNIQNVKEINKNYQLQVRLNQNVSPQKLLQIPMFGPNLPFRQNKGDIIVEENESPLYRINLQRQGLNEQNIEKKGYNSPFYKSGLVNNNYENQFYRQINASGYRSYNQEIGNASDITNIKQPKYEGLSSEMLNNAVESIQKKSGFTNKTFIKMDSRLKGQKGLVIKRQRVSNLSEIKDQDQKDELGGYTGEDGVTMKNEDNIEQTSINFNKMSSLEGPGRETMMGGAAILGTSFVRTKSQMNEKDKNFQNIIKNQSSDKQNDDSAKNNLNQNLQQNNISMLSQFKPNQSSPKSSFKRKAGSQLAYYETIQEESIGRDTTIAIKQVVTNKVINPNINDIKNQIKIEHNEHIKDENKQQKKIDGNTSNISSKSPRNQKIYQKILKQQDYDFQQVSKAVGANIEKPQLNTTIYNISPIEVYIENKSANQQNKFNQSPQKSQTQRPKQMLQKQIFQKIKEQVYSPQQTNTKGFKEQPLQISNIPELKKTIDFANLNNGNMNNPYLSYYIGQKHQQTKNNVPSISQALIQKNMELNISIQLNNGQANSIKNTIKRSISPNPTSQDNRASPKSNNSQKHIISINEKERASISIGIDQTSRKAISNLNMQPIYKGKQIQDKQNKVRNNSQIEENPKVKMLSQNVQIKLQELQELQELNELFEQTVNEEMSDQNKNMNESIDNQDKSQMYLNDIFNSKNYKMHTPLSLHEAQNSKEVEKVLQYLLKNQKVKNTEEVLFQIGKLKTKSLVKMKKYQSLNNNQEGKQVNNQIQDFINNKNIQITQSIESKKQKPLNFISQEDLYELQYILSQSPDFLVQNYDKEIQDYLMEAYNEQKKYQIEGKIKDHDLYLRKQDYKVKRNYEELYYSARASKLSQQYLQMIKSKIFDSQSNTIDKNLKPKFVLSQKQDGKDIKVKQLNNRVSDLEFIKNNIKQFKNGDDQQYHKPSRLEQILEKLKIIINSEGDQSYEVENALKAETNAKIDDDNQIQGRLKELMEKCLYFTASQKKKESMALGDDEKRIGTADQSLAQGWDAWDTETESNAGKSIIISQRKRHERDKDSDKWFESNPIFTKDVVNPENDEVLQMIKERYLGLDEEHDRRWKNKYTFLETNNLQDIYLNDLDIKSNLKQASMLRQNSKDFLSSNNDNMNELPRNKLILKNQSKVSLSPSNLFPGGVSDLDIQMRHKIQDTIVLNKKFSKATISPQLNRNISSKTIQSLITLQDTETFRKKAIERQQLLLQLKKEKQQLNELKIDKKQENNFDKQLYGNILQDSSFILPSIYDDKIAKIVNPDQEILPQRKRNLSVQSVQVKNPFSQESSSAFQLNQQNLRKLDQQLQQNQHGKKYKSAQKDQNFQQQRLQKNIFGQIDLIKNLNTTQLIDEFKENINGPDSNQIQTQLYYRKDLTYLDKLLPEIKVPLYRKYNLTSPLSLKKQNKDNSNEEIKQIQQNFGINNISEKEYIDSFKQPLIYKYQLRQPKYQLTDYAKYLEEQENQKLMKKIDKVKNQETMEQLKKLFDKIM